MTLLVLAIAANLLVDHLATSLAAPSRPPWMSPFAWAVGTCETPRDGNHWPHFDHHAGDYEGFVGWYHGTWMLDRLAGMPAHAYDATPRQQYRVALRSFARHRYFGCIAHGGYRVWMAS